MKLWWTGCLFLLHTTLLAQSIQGRVFDKVTGTPVPGATIYIESLQKGAVSDSLGYFEIKNIEPDRYKVTVSHVAYNNKTLNNQVVNAGKRSELEISLDPLLFPLSEIVVSPENTPFGPGRKVIDEEQINRFAATYYDPARLMASSAEVYVTNDQNNEVSIRGISPNYNVWRLEGAEIVNPNHLANAGTIDDQPAGTSGGVNILSAQMLSTSSLHFGAFDNTLNNSVGGIFDMNLKKGVRSDHQFTTQASFIGFDLSAEGPFDKSKKATFITNYRYSFTGLLTNMGVDFGGESIGFQDLSFTFHFPFKEGEGIKIFGSGGLNTNDFAHRSLDESEEEKDRKDIFYDGKMGLTGFTYQMGRFHATVVYSGLENNRFEQLYDSLDARSSSFSTVRTESILATNLYYTIPLTNGNYTFGVVNNFYEYAGIKEGLSQFYLNVYWGLASWLDSELGVTTSTSDISSPEFDPRITLRFWPFSAFSVHVGGGKYSQLLKPTNFYFVNVSNENSYFLQDNYQFIRSYRATTGLQYKQDDLDIQMETFLYHFPEVNYVNSLDSSGNATTLGISVDISRAFSGDWYLLAGGNWFDSKIDDDISNPFDVGFGINLASGKEWKWSNPGSGHVFSVDGRLTWQGGLKYTTPIADPLVSPFSNQLNDYIRFDLRVDWKRTRSNRSTTLALDLQNVTNRSNQGYVYFDDFLIRERISEQLGLIPILTYRIEF